MDHIKAGKRDFAGLRLQGELIKLNWLVRACFNRSNYEAGTGAEAVLRRSVFSLANSELPELKFEGLHRQVRRQMRRHARRQATLFNLPWTGMGVPLILYVLRGITESLGIRIGRWRARGTLQWFWGGL